jgi:hypothetical protein
MEQLFTKEMGEINLMLPQYLLLSASVAYVLIIVLLC